VNVRTFLATAAVASVAVWVSGAEGPQAASPSAASQPPPSLATPAFATAVAELKSRSPAHDGSVFVSWAEMVTPAGQTFLPVSLFVPKSSAAGMTQVSAFFGVIENESGTPVAAFERPAALMPTKDEFFVDFTLAALPAGRYRGYFGIAAGGKPVALARTELTLAGRLDRSAAAVSPLILSNNVYPLSKPQASTDPFAFGGMKVVPKGDKVFRASTDELWYFFVLRNPGLTDSIRPDEGTITGAPPERGPKVQTRIRIAGKTTAGTAVNRSAPMADAPAMALRGVPGHFAVGSAFPPKSFKPGDYAITIDVVDAVTKASYTLSDSFRIVE
jgi:hypothetical protein